MQAGLSSSTVSRESEGDVGLKESFFFSFVMKNIRVYLYAHGNN